YVPERERAHRHDSGGADEERAEGTPTLQNEAHRIAERRFALLGRAEPAQDLILPLRLADGEHQTGKDEAWQTHEQKAHLPSGKIAEARHMKRRQGADVLHQRPNEEICAARADEGAGHEDTERPGATRTREVIADQ